MAPNVTMNSMSLLKTKFLYANSALDLEAEPGIFQEFSLGAFVLNSAFCLAPLLSCELTRVAKINF